MDAATLPVSASLRATLTGLDNAHRALARQNANAFMSYVLRDEETGRRVLQSPIHADWHDLIDQHDRVLIWAHIEAGKTSQIALGRVLYELGRNPNLRIAIVSNTDGQAQKVTLTLQKYIEQSAELASVFPKLKRAKGMPWTQHKLFVERTTRARDPSVQTCGVHGNILGSRVDLLILDDLLDYENTLSPTMREDLWNWYHATLEGRLTRHSRVLCIGTAWHREDIMHRFSKNPAWFARRYPVLTQVERPDGTVVDAPTWPERWPLERVKAKQEALGPVEYSRQLLCTARSDEDARFKREWIENCMNRGLGRPYTHSLVAVPPGYSVYTGVDLGVRVQHGSDLTAIFTIVVHPNGDREVLECLAGRWAGPEIVERIVDVHHRYHSIVLVESVAAQQFIVDFTKAMSAVPVKSFSTVGSGNVANNVNHHEFGIEGLATEMANGKWIIPSVMAGGRPVGRDEQIEAWVGELLYYMPRAHPGDRLMASWFAQSGAKSSQPVKPKIQFGRVNLSRGGV